MNTIPVIVNRLLMKINLDVGGVVRSGEGAELGVVGRFR